MYQRPSVLAPEVLRVLRMGLRPTLLRKAARALFYFWDPTWFKRKIDGLNKI